MYSEMEVVEMRSRFIGFGAVGLLALAALVTGLLTGLLGPAVSSAQSPYSVDVGGNAELGDFLIGSNGMTLYIFLPDEPGVSNCSGDCADAWPPLTVADGEQPMAAAGVSGVLGTIVRDDGSIQVTLDDAPLYYFVNDAAVGDANGEGINDVWFVIPVAATETPTPPASGSAGLLSGGSGTSVALLLALATLTVGTVAGARLVTRRRV